ncbi:glycosyl transferase [Lacrimispora amygdalina]|uniref:Glycosyl transferase n=1 Tax=Lacrimispora amygdalina TaxID=253257 RepID=A0ABQ5M8S7_9FIRM
MITVLLAAWNGEKYLKEQMESLLGQTNQEFTILISDDGSTDRTPEIISEYENRFPDRIKSLKNIKPSGSARDNFFRLLKAASDEYLMFCDQDDIWLPDKVEVTFTEMKKMEKEWGRDMPLLVHTDLSVADQAGAVLYPSMARYQKIGVYDNRTSHYLVENNITGNTMMINRSLKNLMVDIPKTCVMHDWWLGLIASCFGKISYIDRPLVLYRQHGSNQVGAKSGMKQLSERRNSREKVRDNYGSLFEQAKAFLSIYGQYMTPDQRELFEEFLKLCKRSRAGKIKTILKYKLFKSTRVRTLGQMLSI